MIQNTKEIIKNLKSLDNHYRIIAAPMNQEAKGVFADLDNFEDEEKSLEAEIINIKL